MAINPLPFLQNMPDPGQAFMQSFDVARQQRDQQVQEQSRQAQYQQFLQRIRQDRSPETMAEFALAFPEQSKAVQEAFAPLEKAEREGRFKYNAQVFSALRGKDTARAKELLQERITAARNTRGREQEAAELEYWLPQIDKDPEGALDALSISMFSDNPDAYKELYGKTGELTGFQKDLAAAGIDPQSEQGVAKARQYAELKVDPIVQMPTPNGGQFIGKQSEYYRMFGGGAPPPEVKRLPRVGEVRNGFMFNGGDPADKSNWVKANPLQSTKAPETNTAGMPASLTMAQYKAIVEVKGKAETDAWMLRNNVQITGQ